MNTDYPFNPYSGADINVFLMDSPALATLGGQPHNVNNIC